MDRILDWAFENPFWAFVIVTAVLGTLERIFQSVFSGRRQIESSEPRAPTRSRAADYEQRRLEADERLLDRATGVRTDEQLEREIAAAVEERTDAYVETLRKE